MPGGGSQPASNDAEPCCSGRDTRAQQADDLRRALLRVQAGAVRGALIGFTLRGGLHLAGHVLSALGSSRGRQKRAVNGAAAIKDTLRYTGFLAALAACYIGVEEGISRIFGKERYAPVLHGQPLLAVIDGGALPAIPAPAWLPWFHARTLCNVTASHMTACTRSQPCHACMSPNVPRVLACRSSKWRALVAGICAGHTLLLTG